MILKNVVIKKGDNSTFKSTMNLDVESFEIVSNNKITKFYSDPTGNLRVISVTEKLDVD